MRRIGDEVKRELKRFGPQAGLGKVVEAWPGAVGEMIARNAWPARITRDGTLLVHTSSSAWAFELAQLESEVKQQLGKVAPARFRFVPGPLPEPELSAADKAAVKAPTPSPEETELAAALAAAIDDEKLRNLVARAAASSLAKHAE
jgi:hypothetical protein